MPGRGGLAALLNGAQAGIQDHENKPIGDPGMEPLRRLLPWGLELPDFPPESTQPWGGEAGWRRGCPGKRRAEEDWALRHSLAFQGSFRELCCRVAIFGK